MAAGMTSGGEFRTGLAAAWLAVSAVLALVLLAPLVLGGEAVGALAPVCEWKAKYNRPCVACGMTTSFIRISEGRFAEAGAAHPAGMPLYAVSLANVAAALAWAVRRFAFRRIRGMRRPS